MNSVLVTTAVASMDAGSEPTGMYSRRAVVASTEVRSGTMHDATTSQALVLHDVRHHDALGSSPAGCY